MQVELSLPVPSRDHSCRTAESVQQISCRTADGVAKYFHIKGVCAHITSVFYLVRTQMV